MFDLINIPIFRSLVWRIGRRLYQLARRDIHNDPKHNGEYWLIQKVIENSAQDALTLVDIGANKGDWSAHALDVLKLKNVNGRIYAFEPALATFEFLSERFKGEKALEISRIALSDTTGEVEFFVNGALSGTNSLSRNENAVVEKVKTQKFEEFFSDHKLEKINFVKSDTEGYDFCVMRGANDVLKKGLVDIWQFEYNFRWVIGSGGTLKDVFDFISDKPYRFGKLYGNGIEVYDQWHPELERFFEGNYVLVRKGSFAEGWVKVMRFDTSNVPQLV